MAGVTLCDVGLAGALPGERTVEVCTPGVVAGGGREGGGGEGGRPLETRVCFLYSGWKY